MKWRSTKEQAELYSLAKSTDSDILGNAERLGTHYERYGNIHDFVWEDHIPFPRMVQALTLVVAWAKYGSEFFDALTSFERAAVVDFSSDLIALHAEVAATANHKGEADERLRDSE